MTLVLPPFLPPMLVTLAAGHFPEGDEDVLRHDLADAAWDYTKTQLNVLADRQAEQAQAVAASVVGEAGSAAAERMRAAEQNLRDLADFCASLTEHVKTAARDIEFEKLVVIFTLCILAVQLALAAAFPGGALVALARWITAKKTIQSVYLQLLARLVLNGADIVGSQPLLAILMRGGGSGAIQGGGADLVAQSLQIGADTRDIVDRQQLLVTTAAGFAGGVAGDVAARWMQPLTEAMGQLAGSAVGRRTQWMVELAVPAGVGGAAGAVAGTGTAVLMVGGDFGDIELAQTMYQGIGEGLIGAAGYALRPPATPLPGPVEQASVVPDLSQALGNHRDSHPLISSEPGTEPMVSGGVSGSVPPLAVPEHSVPRSAPPVSHDVSIPIPVHTPLAMDIDTPADSPTATDSRSESRSAREYSEESAAAAADSLPAARQESTQQPARPAVVEGDPNIRGTAEQLRDGAADRPLDARGADTVATELDTWPAPLAEPIQATASETVIPQRDMPAVSPEPRASDSTADRPEMSRDVYESQPAAKGDQVAPQDGYATQESADGLVLPAGVGDASNPASRPTPAAVRPNQGRTADSAARTGGTKESDHPPAQADTPTEATPTVFAPQDRTRQRPSSDSASAAVRPPDRTEPPSAADRGPDDAAARDDLITSSPEDVKLSAAVGEFDPRGDDATASGADDPGDQANGEIGGRFDEFRTAPDIAPADKYAPLEDRAHLVAVQDALRGPDGRTRVHADPSKNRYGRLINDGGITKRGRSNNCVQLGIDAILSYYGRSAVSLPRIVWPRPVNGNEDVPLGEPWKRLEEWTGQLFRPPSDAVTVADQFDHLHAEVARMGPGSAALVHVRWETPAVDEEPAQRDGHILELVYPEGAAKPVWWDAQSGETWDSPPSVWIEHSDDLFYIPITQEQGADLAAAASPDEARYDSNIGRGATVRWVPDTVLAENRRGSFALAAGRPTGASGQARGGDGARQKPNSDGPENLSQPTDIGALPEPADYSPTYSGFGRWLRDAVGGLGMDEVQFAAAAGVNTEVVHRWLDGSGHPSPAVMQRLRDDSGLPADTLQAAVERFGLRDSSGTLYQLDTTFDAALDPRRFSETGAKLGNWLRATMDNRGKTASDLAQALGVSVPTVEKWLRNESPPNLENQRRLRENLGIPGDIWAIALEEFRIRGEGARPARSRRPPETGEPGPEQPMHGLDERRAEGPATETVASIRDIDASNANTVRTMLGLWLTSWTPDPQYVREIADAVAATVAATAGSVELVVTSPGPAGESGLRDIAVIESFTGTVDSRSETVWRLSREPSVVERAVAEAGHSPLAWEIGHGRDARDAQAEDTEVDRQEARVRKQLRAEHPWMTADQINAAAAMFAETYARGLVDSPDPAGRVTIESTAEGPRGRGMRLTVETTLSEGRAVHLSPWYGDRPATESAGSGSPAAAGPHFLARADANGRSVELGTESRTVTHWFEIHHGSARQALTDVGPSPTSGSDRPPYRGLPEPGGSGISRRDPNISDERETGGGAVGLPGTDPGAGNLGPPRDDGPPFSQPDSGAGETSDRGVAPGLPNVSDDAAGGRSGRGPGVGEGSPALRTAQARTLRMSCRTRAPEGGVALVVDGRNRSENTVDRPAYQARRFDIDGSPVVVADVFVHLTPNLTASAHEKNAVLGNVRVAVDKILNASPAARLPSGERLVIDVVDTEEPADGHLLVWYGQPGSGPDLWTSDDDARVIVDRVRRQLGLPITPAGDEPGFTGDDMHTLAEDLAAAAAGRNDSLSATRVIGPGGLGLLEKRGHQERVEEALREGDRYAVWADPMENPYGKLINAGGFGQPGRNTNCVDCVVAALDSFFGRPTVAYPRWIDRAVSLDTAVGEHRGAQRIAGAVGREWYVPEPDSGTVRDQLEELHRQVRRSGPGTAAIISNRWREDDGEPGASHVSLLVHPKGESGPVWWDPQSGELSREVPEKLAEHSLSVKAITVPPGADPFSGRNTDTSVSHSPEYVRDERVLSEKPDSAPVPPEPFSEEVPVVWEDDVAVVRLRPRPVEPVRVEDSEGHHSGSDHAHAFPSSSDLGRPDTIVFDSAESVRAYAQEHWYDGTENHKLLNTYVTEGSAINHYLRGNPDWRNHTRRPWSEADVDSIVEQIRVMMKPLPDAVVVQRRVKPNRLSALREGDTVEESAFLSTTPDPNVPVYLEHMPGVLHLTVSAGTPVAFLRNGDDNEILLPPGIQWRVTDIVETDENVRVHGVVGGAEEITNTPDPGGSSFPGPAEHSSFGDWLKSVRSHFGLSPKMFAVEVGVATRTVYNWESGRIPRHGHLLLIDRLERMPSGALQGALDHFGVRDKTGNVVQLDSSHLFSNHGRYDSFGSWLQRVREDHLGMTASRLGARIGVAASTVNYWEAGEVPGRRNLLALDKLEGMPSGALQAALDHFRIRDTDGNPVQVYPGRGLKDFSYFPSFNDWLAGVRVRLELTQAEFAAELGVGVMTVIRWESGRIPRHGHLLLIDRLERMPSGALQDALDHFGVRDKTGNVVQLDSSHLFSNHGRYDSFGSWLQRVREEHLNTTQDALGEVIGVTGSVVRDWESGKMVDRSNLLALDMLEGMPSGAVQAALDHFQIKDSSGKVVQLYDVVIGDSDSVARVVPSPEIYAPDDFSSWMADSISALGMSYRDFADAAETRSWNLNTWIKRGMKPRTDAFFLSLHRNIGVPLEVLQQAADRFGLPGRDGEFYLPDLDDPDPREHPLNRWLRKTRQFHGLTKEELANRIGVQPLEIRLWEGDSATRPTMRNLRKFCHAVGVPAELIRSAIENYYTGQGGALGREDRDTQEVEDLFWSVLVAAPASSHEAFIRDRIFEEYKWQKSDGEYVSIEEIVRRAVGRATWVSGDGARAEDVAQDLREVILDRITLHNPLRGTFVAYAVGTAKSWLKGEYFRFMYPDLSSADRDRVARVSGAVSRHSEGDGAVPDARELAAELGMRHEDVEAALQLMHGRGSASGGLAFEDGRTRQLDVDVDAFRRVELDTVVRETMAQALEREFPGDDRVKDLVELCFIHQIPVTESAAHLGMQPDMAARILAEARIALRGAFADQDPHDSADPDGFSNPGAGYDIGEPPSGQPTTDDSAGPTAQPRTSAGDASWRGSTPWSRKMLASPGEQVPGSESHAAIAGVPAEPDDTPRVSTTRGRSYTVPDLSAVAPLGELLRVDPEVADDHELTSALKGLEQQYGPYRLTDIAAMYMSPVKIGGYPSSGIYMSGRIVDENGTEVGFVQRNFEIDENDAIVANHELFKLEEHARRKGFAGVFSTAIENYYRRCGVDRIGLLAADEDGGLVWARAGYDWDPDQIDECIEDIGIRIAEVRAVSTPRDQQVLDEILERLEGPVEDMPTPREIVLLSGDDPKLGESVMKGSVWHGMRKL